MTAQDFDAINRAANAAMDRGAPEEAIKLLSEACARPDAPPSLHDRYALQLGRVGRTDEQRHVLNAALKRFRTADLMMSFAALLPWSERFAIYRQIMDGQGLTRQRIYLAWKAALAVGDLDAADRFRALYGAHMGTNAEFQSLQDAYAALRSGRQDTVPDPTIHDRPELITSDLLSAIRALRWNRSYSGPGAMLWRTPLTALVESPAPAIQAFLSICLELAGTNNTRVAKAWALSGTIFVGVELSAVMTGGGWIELGLPK